VNLAYTRLWSRHADEIHAELLKLGWNKEEIRRRTGIDRARIKLFMDHKHASLKTGVRLALAIAAARA